MYCPECFNKSLILGLSGKGYLALNGKQSNTAIFLFNTIKQDPDEIQQQLEEKMDELLKWYSGFKNISPITRFEIYSSDFRCENDCSIKKSSKISLIGPLLNEKKFYETLDGLAKKHGLSLKLDDSVI